MASDHYWDCFLCGICTIGYPNLLHHVTGKRHDACLQALLLGSECFEPLVWQCWECNDWFGTEEDLLIHCRAPSHLEQAGALGSDHTQGHCECCSVTYADEIGFYQHLTSKSHLRAVRRCTPDAQFKDLAITWASQVLAGTFVERFQMPSFLPIACAQTALAAGPTLSTATKQNQTSGVGELVLGPAGANPRDLTEEIKFLKDELAIYQTHCQQQKTANETQKAVIESQQLEIARQKAELANFHSQFSTAGDSE